VYPVTDGGLLAHWATYYAALDAIQWSLGPFLAGHYDFLSTHDTFRVRDVTNIDQLKGTLAVHADPSLESLRCTARPRILMLCEDLRMLRIYMRGVTDTPSKVGHDYKPPRYVGLGDELK
jgi:hypothetical protein